MEYSFDECHLDHQEHMKPPRKEQVNTAKNMKLQFKVGKAELDKTDSVTVAALDSLKEELIGICMDPAAKLRELHFEGFSSPEGSFAKNQDLSNRRTMTVRNEVLSVIPADQRSRVYQTSRGFVSGWDEVATLLERDSLFTEASVLRGIVEKYPGNLDRQGADIRRLPYYQTLIKERLSELRQVKCKHLAEVMRFLTPEEILHKYNTDADYRNGKKMLTLNEYWHLFALIKDEKALEGIYKRALVASKRAEGRPWALPANNLAVLYLRREQADTNLLKPFLKDGRPMNYEETDFDTGLRIRYNHPEVIANQVLVNKRSRETAESARINIKKKLTGTIDIANRVEKFVNCRSKDPNVRELYIVEGDSALTSCKLGRSAEMQAIIPVRGKTLNCLKADYERIFKSDIITDLLRVIGCGVEINGKIKGDIPHFDLDNLRWSKIIICTDADEDGFQIRTLLLTMFYRLLPTLIQEQRVFIAETPLFEITVKDKGKEQTYFAYDEFEKADILKEIGNKKYSIQRSKGLGENEPEMMWQTTMNPEPRRLVAVTPTDPKATEEIFDTLLGDNLPARKAFIAAHGKEYMKDLDV